MKKRIVISLIIIFTITGTGGAYLYMHPALLFPTAIKITQFFTGLKEKNIKTKNHTWSYLEGGSGETIVFIHGFGADKNRLISILSPMSDNYRVIAPDLPGHGNTRHDPSLGYNGKAMITYLENFIRKLGLKKFHLWGSSMGGGIAVMYAASNPEKVKSLCLFNPAGFPSPEKSPFWQLYETRGEIALLYTNRKEFYRAMDMIFYDKQKFPDHIVDYIIEMKKERIPFEKKLFINSIHEGTAPLLKAFKSIKMPVLLVWGAGDGIIDPSTAHYLAKIRPDTELHILKRSGHIPFAEQPGESEQIYKDFLRKL